MVSPFQRSCTVVIALLCALGVAGCGDEATDTKQASAGKKSTTIDQATTSTTDTTTATTTTTGTTSTTGAEPGAPLDAFLTITLDQDGKGSGKPVVSKLECASEFKSKNPACLALSDNPAMLDPEEPGKLCTEQYGGPQTATVKGTVNGKDVSASFSRSDGCQIARWEAAKALWEKNS